jgi:hypothetical protein
VRVCCLCRVSIKEKERKRQKKIHRNEAKKKKDSKRKEPGQEVPFQHVLSLFVPCKRKVKETKKDHVSEKYFGIFVMTI